jgi:hypothetical protein
VKRESAKRTGALRPFLVKQAQAEPEVAWRPRDHITPGQYPAFSCNAKIFRDGIYKRWTCLVNFDVLDDSLIVVIARLGWFLNLGHGEEPRAGQRGRYWAAWILANSGRAPKRNDRLAPGIFRNRHAVVLVRDVERDFRGVTSQEPYSVVADVLSWETGGGL